MTTQIPAMRPVTDEARLSPLAQPGHSGKDRLGSFERRTLFGGDPPRLVPSARTLPTPPPSKDTSDTPLETQERDRNAPVPLLIFHRTRRIRCFVTVLFSGEPVLIVQSMVRVCISQVDLSTGRVLQLQNDMQTKDRLIPLSQDDPLGELRGFHTGVSTGFGELQRENTSLRTPSSPDVPSALLASKSRYGEYSPSRVDDGWDARRLQLS